MSDAVLQKIEQVIHQTFGDSSVEVNRDTIAEDVPGWDSLSHTIFVLMLEDAFGITLPPDTNLFANIGELADAIETLVSAQ